jgi:hypothetical protein
VLMMPKRLMCIGCDMHAEEEWYGLTSTTGSPLGETPGGKGAGAGRDYYP